MDSARITARILDILKEQQVPAAFFLVGDYLERNADLVRRIAQEGHTVGNHTMNHPDMTKLDGAAFAGELQGMEQLYQDVTGRTLPKFYRPPQGLYSEENLENARKLGEILKILNPELCDEVDAVISQ